MIERQKEILRKDEYLFKTDRFGEKQGYMSKVNKDNSVPLPFISWYAGTEEYSIVTEEYNHGWKVGNDRKGASTCWVELIHPIHNVTVEVRADTFLLLLKNITIENGLILNKCYFKAEDNMLLALPIY